MSQAENLILMDFVPRLRACRREMGLTQAQFASKAGVGLGAQNRYEAGATEPSASYFAHLAAAGADIVWLLTGHRTAQLLSPDTNVLVDAFVALPAAQRQALLTYVTALAEIADHPEA